jgi:hypothetical protein
MRRQHPRAESAWVEPASNESPSRIELTELAAILDEELANLSTLYSCPIVLCELQGRSRKDAAAELGIPEGTLSSRLAKGKKLLAQKLAGRGLISTAPLGTALGCTIGLPASLAARTVEMLFGASPGGPALIAGSAVVDQLAKGVVKAMVLSKLKGLAVIVLPVLLCFGGLGGAAVIRLRPSCETDPPVAAPAASQPMGENRIWIQYRKTGKVVVLDQKGQPKREIDLKDGPLLRGISPADNRLWFLGQDGRLPILKANNHVPTGRYTLHVRQINDKAEGTDLGVELTTSSVVSRDAHMAGLVVYKGGGSTEAPFIFENSVVDLSTKRITKLNLPTNHQILGIASDKTWALTFEYNIWNVEKGSPPYRLHKVPLVAGKSQLLSGMLSACYGGTISPDSTRVLAFAQDFAKREKAYPDVCVYVIDVVSQKATRISVHKNQYASNGIWSPDGRRIAYVWRSQKDDGTPTSSEGLPPTRLVICDADGQNEETILTTDEHIGLLAWW